MIYFLQLLAAILLDALVGDPPWYPHPVRAIGRVCSWSEGLWRAVCSNMYLAGTLTVMTVLCSTGAAVGLLLLIGSWLSPAIAAAIAVILLYTTIAARDLLRHSNEVYVQLTEEGSLENARKAVAMIVGRDTKSLDQDGICRAAIETVAENMVDGITAPLFFAVLASCFAPVLHIAPISCSVFGAFIYKAVNTMDSMIAYKNDRYIQFGRVAARLDDLLNFLPARISGVCLIVAAIFLRLDYRNAARVFLRDRCKHSSPNAGHTEAAAAGALGVRLGGPSYYFNSIVEKPYIGNSAAQPVPEDIKRVNVLVVAGSLIFLILLLGLRLFII